uniref:CHAT domain-containing protein n=1 Tax=uncultured bacterium A1Q1_fos_1880 TaxID=1256556 RepID=L7VWS7_9BACT|nr:hypothetical protein [uncultured bacterium A1Q1_fos_1880]
MTDYADLDISLTPGDDASKKYRVKLTAHMLGNDAPQSFEGFVTIDHEALGKMEVTADYGQQLTDSLFEQPVRDFFEKARAIAQNSDIPLRLRISIGLGADILHNLQWERLRDPDPENPAFLCQDQQILFSRYLDSDDWRDTKMRPQEDLRALIVVANPKPTDEKPLDKVNVQGEIVRARKGLGTLPSKALYHLPEGTEDSDHVGLPTFDNLVRQLRTGYDILYLACHGEQTKEDGPVIYLEKDDGSIDPITLGEEKKLGGDRRPGLLTQLHQLRVLPRLVVLASCQSAGSGEQWADQGRPTLLALGPQLIKAGVPAVLAMQGNVYMSTVEQFMLEFFTVLCTTGHGQIDRAVADARAKINACEDWWSPTLFMRLKSGCIGWYRPHFADTQGEFETEDGLINEISNSRCVPIIGPGLIRFLMGSPRELALQWAIDGKPHPYPLDRHQRDNLPLVASYLATMQSSDSYVGDQLRNFLQKEVQQLYGYNLSDVPKNTSLGELIRIVGKAIRQSDEYDAYRVLACMPSEIYITTTPDDLLYDALIEAKRKPQRAIFEWNPFIEQVEKNSEFSKPAKERTYKPSKEEPLIYHLFGHIDQPMSLVITEDNYFEYLLAIGRDGKSTADTVKIPPDVSSCWTTKALLFLGFQIDDWVFRVLLHSIRANQGGKYLRRPSLAVPVSPEEDSWEDVESARAFLEHYLHQFTGNPINVFWGSTQDLLNRLWDQRTRWQFQG